MFDALASSLVMYYEAVCALWKKERCAGLPLVVSTIDAAMEHVGGQQSSLLEWSRLVQQQWIADNLPWFRIETLQSVSSDVKDKISIGYYSFEEVLQNQAKIQHQFTQALVALQREVRTQAALVRDLQCTLEDVSKNQLNILQLLQHSGAVPL